MKKRFIGTVIAIIMCMALSVFAFADASLLGNPIEYDSPVMRHYGEGIYNYTSYSALYVDGGNYYRGATWVETINHVKVTAGYMKAYARLFDSSGAVLEESGEFTNIEDNYFVFAATDSLYYRYGIYSQGTVSLWNGERFVTEEIYKIDSSGDTSRIAYQLIDGEYSVNSNGKTYGSALFSDVVGYEPELIYAIGIDGQRGFIKQEDITPTDTDTPEKALAYMKTRLETYTIPLYNLEEEVIGEFEVSADLVTTSTTLEEAKEMLAARGRITYSGPVEQTELINGKFPVNINGETYGNGLMAIEVGHDPDLLSAWGTNGQKGYIKQSDIRSCPEDATPQEVYEWYTSQPKSYEIPLYDFQGNIIGSFSVKRGTLTDKEIEAKIH